VLLAVHGVGLKTVDYLGSLVGGSHVAVDVRLRAFARDAGVEWPPISICAVSMRRRRIDSGAMADGWNTLYGATCPAVRRVDSRRCH